MKTIFFTLLLTITIFTNGRAQDCLGMTLKSGMNFEMSLFDAKDKPTGKTLYQVKDVRREGSSTLMDINATFEDGKGKQRPPYSIHYTCTGNELLADMSGMMQSMQNSGMKDMEMKMKTNQLIYPSKLSVGQTLKDGQMALEMLNNGTTMMEMTMTMSNRKVDSKEPITTPAGTFDAYKVSSDVSYENRVMGMPIRNSMRVVSYRADGQLFDVKSETYNKSGKLMGYSLLNKVN